MQQHTLIFLYKPDTGHILLAMKKRGFGEGKWNGVGGKVDPDESVEEAAVRETKEEIGVDVDPADLRKRGVIHFSFEGKPELERDVYVFFAERWEGEPVETEEMRPRWYSVDVIPYERMWVDDRHWLPYALLGKTIDARFHLSASGEGIMSMDVRETAQMRSR